MAYDLSNVLTTMASCSATFVAIIGGLIANKAISDSSEKESIRNQLKQIDAEINLNDTRIDELSCWLNEYDAKDYVDDHLCDLLQLKPLEDIYDNSNKNDPKFENLKPYWERAIAAIKLYQQTDEQEPRNTDKIPCDVAEKLDTFQYHICRKYRTEIENGAANPFFHIALLDGEWRVYKAKQRSNVIDELEQTVQMKTVLIAKEELLEQRYNAICLDRDIKKGIWTFTIISAVNIILPVIFMWFNPTASWVWYLMESGITYILFIIGVIVMIRYICSLFPRKEDK